MPGGGDPPWNRRQSASVASEHGAKIARPHPATARWLVLLAAVLFSTGGAGIKSEAFTAAQVSALRSAVAALTLAVWLGRRLRWSWGLAGVGIVYAVTLILFVTSTKLTTAANAIFLQSAAPLYLLALGPLVLHERWSTRDAGVLATMLAGLLLCVSDQPAATMMAPAPALGNLLGVLCGASWAATLTGLRLMGRRGHAEQLGLSAVVMGNLIAAAMTLPAALPLPAAPPAEWATIAYLGVVQIGVAYVCLTAGLAVVPAFEASLLLLVEPALNPVWTWLVRGERPGRGALAGGALILAATALTAIRDRRGTAQRTSDAPAEPGATGARY